MDPEKKETTTVQKVEVDLNEILGTGVEQVMTPEDSSKKEEKKKTIFSPITVDTEFLNEDLSKNKEVDDVTKTENKTTEETSEEVNKPLSNSEVKDVLDIPSKEEVENDLQDLEDLKNKGGRPSALVSAAKSMIEKGTLMPFDDDKKLEDYTAADFEELIEANFSNAQQGYLEELPKQFINSLPDEMKQAYEYIAQGGKDLKGMFAALSASTEIRDLDPKKEKDAKNIIRTYLNATNYGTPDEIEDEIYSLEDRGDLEKKANQFHPKLDAMKERVVQDRIRQQEEYTKMRQVESQKYVDNLYKTLDKGELNGIPLDNKTQNMLYAGLVQSNYPSQTGENTNMLGHLLEKYQWQEPRHDLIAEALWLLADPDGYKANFKNQVSNDVNQETLRTLKTEQNSKTANGHVEQSVQRNRAPKRTVQRPSKSFFKR